MENSGFGGPFPSGTKGHHPESPIIHRHQPTFQLGHPSLAHSHAHAHARQHGINLVGCLDDDDDDDHHHHQLYFGSTFDKGKAGSTFPGTNGGNLSEDDDEPSFAEDGAAGVDDCGGGANKCEKGSLWLRMKWTDDVVRLLIAAVAYVGDDGTSEEGGVVEGLKRKSGFIQKKKGKWKSVSKLMMSKGCHASPQQCEDKFNELNKRYKKLNDILGRGTSCLVVENPALMDSIPHLSAKKKDDVRKILSSKHLFYKEMCAYHNGQMMPNCHDLDLQGGSLTLERHSKEINGLEGQDVQCSSGNDDDESDSEDDNADDYGERTYGHPERNIVNEEYACLGAQLSGHNGFDVEMSANFQDSGLSLQERRDWFQKQKLQLLEQRVSIQAQAFELEKQRFKWLRYCSKKDRELEQLRLENERKRVETEQSILQLRQKEVEMDLGSP